MGHGRAVAHAIGTQLTSHPALIAEALILALAAAALPHVRRRGPWPAVGFGAALLVSAPAIVLYFALPTAFSALGAIPALGGAARWLDQNRTTTPLLDHALSATEWARLGVSLVLWLAVPMALGFWRVARSDVR